MSRPVVVILIVFLITLYSAKYWIRYVIVGLYPTPAAQVAPVMLDQPTVKHPDGPILYQPHYRFSDGSETLQGTGFFVHAPDDKVVAVSSAHFLDFDGPAMLSAEWIDVSNEKPLTKFTKCWGSPGRKGSFVPDNIDLRKDYQILLAEESVSPERVLTLDERSVIPEGERIYFPNKEDQTWLEGSISHWTPKYITLFLDKPLKLQSQSGSPIISQATGKVIGTLSRGADVKGKTMILLCPARSILNVINNDKTFPLTKDVIGKP